MLLRVLPWSLAFVNGISQTRRRCMITRTSGGTERQKEIERGGEIVTHPHAPRSPFARGSHARETHFERRSKFPKDCISRAMTGRDDSTLAEDGLSRYRETENDDEPSVAKGGGRLRRLPRRALALSASPAWRTHACAWPRACSEGGCARARAQDGGRTCTIIIPLQRPTNF